MMIRLTRFGWAFFGIIIYIIAYFSHSIIAWFLFSACFGQAIWGKFENEK
jgi:hypothetical protein